VSSAPLFRALEMQSHSAVSPGRPSLQPNSGGKTRRISNRFAKFARTPLSLENSAQWRMDVIKQEALAHYTAHVIIKMINNLTNNGLAV
jgi:hypothetical protein